MGVALVLLELKLVFVVLSIRDIVLVSVLLGGLFIRANGSYDFLGIVNVLSPRLSAVSSLSRAHVLIGTQGLQSRCHPPRLPGGEHCDS